MNIDTATWAFLALLTSAPASGQEQPAPPPEPAPPSQPAPASETPRPWKISGLIFGDYYDFAQHDDPDWDSQQGFWFRRIYFTYDHTFSPRLTTRLRLEANSSGRLEEDRLTPYVKDAYLRWTLGGKHQLFLGIQATPTYEFWESIWDLRYIEKSPQDLYRIDTTRDFGVGLYGPLGGSETLRYGVQFGNNSGQGSEVDSGKGGRAALRYDRNPGWFVEGVYAWLARPSGEDRQIAQAFAGFRRPRGRVGLLYVWQQRRMPDDSTDPDLDLDTMSGFAVYDVVPKKWTVFGRLDRCADPNPDGPRTDYLPIDGRAPYTLTIAGVEYSVVGTFRISPNVEWIAYDDIDADRQIDDTIVARVTFFWSW